MRNIWYLIALSALAVATLAAQAAPPRKAEIVYELARNGKVLAEVTHRLEHNGKTYKLTENVRGKGVLAMKGDIARSSQGAIAADGLRPRHFEDQRSGRDTLKADFDPAAKLPTLKQQDQLSMVWTFAFAQPAKEVGVRVADGKRVSEYAYQPAGRERVKTPAGEFDALKFVKKRDSAEDKATEIWIAADRRIPVRVLIVDTDGTRLDQVASRLVLK